MAGKIATRGAYGKALVEFAEKYPKLIGAPLYLGICEITKKGVQNLLIVGGCKEEDKYEIERALFLEYKLLFEKHGIQLGTTDLEEEE